MAPIVEALVTLVGGGQTTPPGGTHEVATKEEADRLVARGLARWPKEAPMVEEPVAAEEVEEGEEAAAETADVAEDVAVEAEEVAEAQEDDGDGDEEEEEEGGEAEDGEIQFASAAARKLAEAEGLAPEDFEGIPASKPNGYTKADVESAAALKHAKEMAGGAAVVDGE